MPASSAMYDPNAEPLRWFTASFKGGHCCHCGEDVDEGEEIAYNAERSLVRRECCGDEPSEPSERSRRPSAVKVMPPGGKRPACTRCFTIHTPAQGDECE